MPGYWQYLDARNPTCNFSQEIHSVKAKQAVTSVLLVPGSIWENNVVVKALCSYLSSGCFKVRVTSE